MAIGSQKGFESKASAVSLSEDFDMNKTVRKIPASLLVAATLSFAPLLLLLLPARAAKAQEATASPQETPTSKPVVFEPPVERDSSGRARVKFERGAKVVVGNKTTGRIVVTGWDRDYIEATATSQNGVEYVWVGATTDASGAKILLKADYANTADMEARRLAALEQRSKEIDERRAELDERKREVEERRREAEAQRAQRNATRKGNAASPPASSATPASPQTSTTPKSPVISAPPAAPITAPSGGPKQIRGPGNIRINPPDVDVQLQPQLQMQLQIQPNFDRPFGDIDLEVKVPRAAEIDMIKVIRSEVEVTGVDTAVTINGDRSTIKLSHVGAAEVRTRSGRVEVDNVRGLVDVITSGGQINVRQAGGDVRALSISGEVVIHCARGRVDVSSTNGAIMLTGIGGDVDATTTDSEVRLTGAIREEGRYHLKSMSGSVEMAVNQDAPGFTALLSSYRGGVKTDFQLQMKESSSNDPRNTSGNRLIGRYGNGQAQITLDSFDGNVKLGKLAFTEIKDCQ